MRPAPFSFTDALPSDGRHGHRLARHRRPRPIPHVDGHEYAARAGHRLQNDGRGAPGSQYAIEAPEPGTARQVTGENVQHGAIGPIEAFRGGLAGHHDSPAENEHGPASASSTPKA
ncbi:hypothetical protein ACF1CG_11250 [Streptomyces sp. NPDC014773]|uniref:hypothetical protein n=1 Tax=Streptomyces sp. NPDC014773 TaxID=3364908 RepID=UPI0036FD0CB4